MKWIGRNAWLLLIVVSAARAADTPKPAELPPAEVKAAFLKLLDRPRVPLDVHLQDTATGTDGLVTERLSFASEKKDAGSVERVPVLLLRPADRSKKLPAVLVLHGTGGTKEQELGLLRTLAHKGIIGVAIDGRYHGERAGGLRGTAAYNAAIIRAWRTRPGEAQEHPLYFDTCWDVWRTIDYLITRPDVDPTRLGAIGFSKGGIECWLAAAVDERIKVAVPAIAVQSFRWSLENGRWQGRAHTVQAAHEAVAHDLEEPAINARVCRALWDKVMPGILGPFDGPSMLRLFAGRPLLILNGERDPNCPLEGAELAFAQARTAYRKAGAEDRLKIQVARGVGHAVTKEQQQAALDWFEKWLQK